MHADIIQENDLTQSTLSTVKTFLFRSSVTYLGRSLTGTVFSTSVAYLLTNVVKCPCNVSVSWQQHFDQSLVRW